MVGVSKADTPHTQVVYGSVELLCCCLHQVCGAVQGIAGWRGIAVLL